jgi:hypothetical protein
MTSKTPLNRSRRSLLISAGATVAAGAALQAIGTGALARPAKGAVKATGSMRHDLQSVLPCQGPTEFAR